MGRVIGILVGLAILVAGGIYKWDRYQKNQRIEALNDRIAVINPVIETINSAEGYASDCIGYFDELTDPAQSLTSAEAKARLFFAETCGRQARSSSEDGYDVLSRVSGADDGPAKTAYLDAAAALLSMYEAQGEDFDLAYQVVEATRDSGTPLSNARGEMAQHLNNLNADINDSLDMLRSAQADYRASDE